MEPPVNNASGGSTPRIMVFRPTWDEFKDFNKYILYMESCGAHKAGLAKVVPPPEWNPRKAGYDMEEIGKILIPSPISQVVTGKQGVYQQLNIQKAKMTVKDFQKVADSDRYKTPRHFDYEDLERKYWKNITYVSPIYGADVAGSLTDSDVEEWNINKLGSILDFINEDYGIQIDGVNTAYLYFGMWKTSFAWHTEDMDLYSINYLHFGAPKSWYAVPPEHGRRLERMANGFFPSNFKECPAYLRHKMFVISPHILKMYSIPYNKITQEPGEFMVTFPYGYHAGFNHGFNCAESTNFASPRWVEYGKRAVQCHCRNDMVKISMDTFVKRFQPERYELWIQGLDVGPHPEDSGRSAAATPPTIDDILCNKNNTIIPDGFFNQKKHKRHPIHKKAKDVELLESGQESSGLEPPSVNEPIKEIKEEVPKRKRKNSCGNQSGGKRRPKNSAEPSETFLEKKPVVMVQRMQPSMDEVSASSMLLRLQSMSGPSPAPGPSSNRGWGQQPELPAYKQQYGFDQRASSEPPLLEAQTYANEGRNPHAEPPLLQPVFEELFTPRQPRDAPPVLSPEGIKQSIKKEELQQPVSQIPDQCSRNVLPTAVAVPIEPRPPSFTDQAPPWSRSLNFLFQDSGCSFQKEAEFNYFCSQAEPNCSVCSLLFAPRHRAVDYCAGDWKLQPPAASASSSPVLLSEQVFAWHIRLGAFTKLPPVENQSTLKISGLLRCSSCCVCVHASCYGVPETTSPYDWLCRRCQAGDSAAACCLCTLRGGALKPTSDGRWAHITCTIAVPEIHFEDLPQREPVNAAHVLKERARLLCIYCQQSRGVCIQCTADRCSQAFHVSCGQAAGARFKPGQFPVGVSVVCTKHKVGQTNPGQLVWARYHNNRFYRARVKSIEDAVFYWVDFSDGSTSKDTYPEDILNYKCKEHGPPPVGAAVHVLWTDGKAYDGTFRGTVSKKMFMVEFEDSTVLSLEKEHVFDLDQDLPKRVQHRICNEHLPNPKNS